MRWFWLVTLACLGCSSSATNDSQNAAGGGGGTDSGVGGAGGSGGSAIGGSAGATSGGSGGTTGGSGGTSGAGGSAGAAGAGGVVCSYTELTINEVSTRTAQGTDEFVELYNPTGSALSLEGYLLQVAGPNGNPATVWAGTVADKITANGYFVIGGTNFPGTKDGSISGPESVPDNGGVALLEGSGILDSIGYGVVDAGHPFVEGNAAKNDGARGSSMARDPDGEDCGNNALDFATTTRTPGGSNTP